MIWLKSKTKATIITIKQGINLNFILRVKQKLYMNSTKDEGHITVASAYLRPSVKHVT